MIICAAIKIEFTNQYNINEKVIDNSVNIICWTVLAIMFHEWWIALFAALFASSLKSNIGKYRICDNCGKHSPYADSHNEALDKAKEAGWITVRNGDKWEDYCPECQSEMYFKR